MLKLFAQIKDFLRSEKEVVPSQEKHFNKLVRDNIVSEIQAAGRQVEYRELGHNQYLTALKIKLCEEVQELKHASSSEEECEELADVLEVIDALKAALEHTDCPSLSKVMAAKERKAKTKGAFGKKHFLIKTY